MRLHFTILALTVQMAISFSPSTFRTMTPTAGMSKTSSTASSSSSALFMGVSRKARRNLKKEQESTRTKSFVDAINEVEETSLKSKKKKNKKGSSNQEDSDAPAKEPEPSLMSGESVSDAQVRMDERPDVSSIVVDEQTGIERIQQGKYVMDVITRKAVKLSTLGPEYRMAQMFPGVPPEIREKHRFDWSTVEGVEIIEKLREACSLPIKDPETGIERMTVPPHPEVSDNALDFVLANRDYLGGRMKKTLGRLKLRAQSQQNLEEALEYRRLWKHFMTIDDSISAPFRQMMMDAEGRVGPNFGNLDLKAFCGTELYERTASYLVLKGMVAHWEKKVRDAEYTDNTQETRSNFIDVLMVGDPKRYLPNPPIIHRYNEVVRIALMAQNMTAQFVNTPELFDDLPAEVRFFEAATFIKGGTSLRQFMIEEFCPAEGITTEGLREGLRRLDAQLANMQIDPYGDVKNVLGRLIDTMSVGTDDARDPYSPYIYSMDKDGPGYFKTYTFNHDRQSLVRFLDNAKEIQQGSIGPTSNLMDQLSNEATNLFGFGAKKSDEKKIKVQNEDYKVPDKRACGRDHNTGWLELLGDEEMNGGNADPEDEVYESDNWREIISKRQRLLKT
mmetsp:Transcript_25717/g.31690  ORF Transcript_25717/g.31690 Transcript_25717/m.31690 type:complete len:617 (-) Transcript_25717:122-1972(-)